MQILEDNLKLGLKRGGGLHFCKNVNLKEK